MKSTNLYCCEICGKRALVASLDPEGAAAQASERLGCSAFDFAEGGKGHVTLRRYHSKRPRRMCLTLTVFPFSFEGEE